MYVVKAQLDFAEALTVTEDEVSEFDRPLEGFVDHSNRKIPSKRTWVEELAMACES
jgi:hypothetical protein